MAYGKKPISRTGRKPMAKRTYSKKTYAKKSYPRATGVTTLRDAADKKVFSGNFFHFSAANSHQCVANVPCSPAINKPKLNSAGNGYDTVAIFPEWLECKQDYKYARVTYMSATIHFDSTASSVHSCIERDSSDLTDTDRMLVSGNMKTHMLDSNNRKVFRAWKASTSQEMDWLPIATIQAGGTACPAYIKMLQDMLPPPIAGLDPTAANDKKQKCEIQLKCVVEFRGKNNTIGQSGTDAMDTN